MHHHLNSVLRAKCYSTFAHGVKKMLQIVRHCSIIAIAKPFVRRKEDRQMIIEITLPPGQRRLQILTFCAFGVS